MSAKAEEGMIFLKYFITGAAGSIGSALVKKLLENKDVAVDAFDNNEYGLSMLGLELNTPSLRLVAGDIRDAQRLEMLLATEHYDAVIHLAALKRVEAAEQNITEAIKTNVLGTINLIEACTKARYGYVPRKFLLVSSDKAVPTDDIGIYGATKFLQERTVLACKTMNCAVARFGNVKGTRGDVFEIWKKQADTGHPFTITEPSARRFWWTMEEAVSFILKCLDMMRGGEIFVPEMKEQSLLDMFRSVYPDKSYATTGLRAGEVLLHDLMTRVERLRAERTEWGWILR